MTDQKISVYSLSDLKNTLDEHIPIYLTSPNLPASSTPLPRTLRFTQSHFRTTVRLSLGYAAVLLALYIFYLDYYLKVPWREHKTITAWCCLGYGILNVVMYGWSWFGGDAGLVFEGRREGKRRAGLRVYSLPPHRKYEPVYRMVVYQAVGGGTEEKKKEVTVPFTSFFQGDGTFVSGEFERWFKGQVPELLTESGKVETGSEVKGELQNGELENGDVIQVQSPSTATGSQAVEDTSTKKRTKKRE